VNKKFSLIIPIYNSEKYIEKCLLSCVNQDIRLSEYEIIVINDGSTDGSLTILENLAKDFHNIIVIDSLNKGASNARNKGLNLAKGKYVWFIDSDDWIESNCLKKIYDVLEHEQLDAVQIAFYLVTNGVINICEKNFRIATPVLTPKDYISPNVFYGAAWGTIFKRDISEKYSIRFDTTLQIAEDQLFLISIFNYAKRLKRENIPRYYYLNNPQSIIHNASEEQLFQTIIKITSFEFREIYKKYCDYLIYLHLLLLMNLKKINSKKIHHLMKTISLEGIFNYNIFRRRDKVFLICYSYFGLAFLRIYSYLRIIYKLIKAIFNKFF